jgi:hypothetical protein
MKKRCFLAVGVSYGWRRDDVMTRYERNSPNGFGMRQSIVRWV